jgi:aminopeptidase C
MVSLYCDVNLHSDVGQFSDSGKGIMDLDCFDYESAFKTDVIFNMTKADRLTYSESLMTHAMVNLAPTYPIGLDRG